jgi:enamine deaminase RidA (YjgF/YER057c/UK114 family)
LPIASDGAKLAEAPFEQQAQQVLDNVALALAGAGSAIDRLVQVRVYVSFPKIPSGLDSHCKAESSHH